MDSFLNLNLIVELKCLDCGKISEFKFRLGDYFNLEGDFLDEQPKQTISCINSELKVFCDLKKVYPREQILKYYDGFKTFQEGN